MERRTPAEFDVFIRSEEIRLDNVPLRKTAVGLNWDQPLAQPESEVRGQAAAESL